MGREVKARRRKAEQLPRVTGEREDILTNWQRGKRVRQRQRETEASGDWQRQRDREVQTETDRQEGVRWREGDMKTAWHLFSRHRRHHTASQVTVICSCLQVLNMPIHTGPISRSLADNMTLWTSRSSFTINWNRFGRHKTKHYAATVLFDLLPVQHSA